MAELIKNIELLEETAGSVKDLDNGLVDGMLPESYKQYTPIFVGSTISDHPFTCFDNGKRTTITNTVQGRNALKKRLKALDLDADDFVDRYKTNLAAIKTSNTFVHPTPSGTIDVVSEIKSLDPHHEWSLNYSYDLFKDKCPTYKLTKGNDAIALSDKSILYTRGAKDFVEKLLNSGLYAKCVNTLVLGSSDLPTK